MKQYDPKKVSVTVAGFVLTGFGEDTFITGSRSSDKRTTHVSAKGEVTFSKSADDTGEVTFTLKHNSPGNAMLKRLYNSDDEFQFACVDANIDGDIGVAGSRCVVKTLPDFERGAEVGEVEWNLLVADYDHAFITDF
ncbi:phage structural protein [Orenia marismortui]|uniref:Uncharacterized protein DUF3277 n=1 Tax=Orenia marismortui TaxID=46469 RepID=A0A4R8GKR2_9FIRM|nr:phage protein [Orenia marismortui]TDX43704.1 uncharacterized protein DUF3277 [Orenia marismortui]